MTEVSNKNLRTRCRKEFKSKINIRMVCAGSSERSCKRKLKKIFFFFKDVLKDTFLNLNLFDLIVGKLCKFRSYERSEL